MKLKNIITLTAAFILFCVGTAFAQPLNDECNTAINLTNLSNWCSSIGAYNNTGATASLPDPPTCIPQADYHDIWFSFVAQANTANITLIGNTAISTGGTINSPQFALYEGSCGNLTDIECASDNSNSNITESFAGPLTIGQTYYLRVDGRDGAEGSFQMCINNFNQVPEPEQDCGTSVILCDKSPFTVQSVVGFGTQEVDANTCMQGESASTWYSWTCEDSGTLAFNLSPNNPSDDLDFIVYELPSGVTNCNDKILLRCMASGENVGPGQPDWTPCTGNTGLSLSSTDVEESPGCQSGDDNFVSAIDMIAGTAYAVVVNNFSNTGNGFSVEFSGTGSFQGPLADFSISPEDGIACDTVNISITDNSTYESGNIISWFWNFGSGANPQSANTEGPHEIIYSSIGTKSISLVVETQEGCIVTKVIEVEVSSCCVVPDDLSMQLEETIDPACAGDSTGVIFLSGNGGNPFYEYSLDGVNFQGGAAFYNLAAGNYSPIYIRDSKGCLDSLNTNLLDPPPLSVDLGEDITIVLGGDADLQAVVSPPSSILDTIIWSPIDSLSCLDCLDPNSTTTNNISYTISVTNLAGCVATDDINITVNKIRPIYIPNAFSPNGDGINDFFTLYGNVAAESIREFRVFNRWGAQVYEGRDLPLGDNQNGWDGIFKGEKSQTGVYAFYAIVRFIDGVEILYEGDVTLFAEAN
ncbi:MAG: gliding motility-associated-like protein [Polaribacter sp.]|jgi:gliding motility-associated-like protein